MNNPFRAALTALNVSLAELDYIGEDTDGVKESLAQIQAAMRVLEYAPKVADALDKAERFGASEDTPEGVRVIRISDKLAKIISTRLRGEADE